MIGIGVRVNPEISPHSLFPPTHLPSPLVSRLWKIKLRLFPLNGFGGRFSLEMMIAE
jgi:hypothetical protein